MRNGICPKCSSDQVYLSDASAAQTAVSTYPLLKIYKENKWVPDIAMLEFNYYVCGSCGHFEMSVRDVGQLSKLDDCTNWRKIERTL